MYWRDEREWNHENLGPSPHRTCLDARCYVRSVTAADTLLDVDMKAEDDVCGIRTNLQSC
jgi:hypothetical protein